MTTNTNAKTAPPLAGSDQPALTFLEAACAHVMWCIGDGPIPPGMDANAEVAAMIEAWRESGTHEEGRALAWRLIHYIAGTEEGPDEELPEAPANRAAVYECFRYLLATEAVSESAPAASAGDVQVSVDEVAGTVTITQGGVSETSSLESFAEALAALGYSIKKVPPLPARRLAT